MATILVIEDEEVMRTMVATCLRHYGHTVIEAGTGREGLHSHAIGAGSFDLVVCDLILPGLGGIETIRVLQERAPGLPIIAISGALHTLAYLSSRGPSTGRVYLQKPFAATRLLEEVDRLLHEPTIAG